VFGLTATELLGLSVVAAVISVVGNLLALALREFLFVRSFERWKERRALRVVYQRYRDPIVLSGLDLLSRLAEIRRTYPTNYLLSEVAAQRPARFQANTIEDPHFRRYKLVSSVYRLCAFLGWLELYRQELTFLDTGRRRDNRNLDGYLEDIRRDLADGQLNQAPDWATWTDFLIFREEQRAVGAAMIVDAGSQQTVMGYGAFLALVSLLEEEQDAEIWWLRTAANFLLDLHADRDFRRIRLERLERDIRALIGVLSPDRLPAGSDIRPPATHQALPTRQAA